MTATAMDSTTDLSGTTIDLMHEFRHEVFVKRIGWSLTAVDNLECDQYDTPAARYVGMCDTSDRVTASARLLPTTGQYMLPELFPQLLGGSPAPSDSSIWELSRLATTVRQLRDGRVLSLSDQTLTLLESVFDLARRQHATTLIHATHIAIERLMVRAGLEAHRIAPPAEVDGRMCVALFIEVPPCSVSCGSHSTRIEWLAASGN